MAMPATTKGEQMSWSTINTNSQITAIHAALLPIEPDGVVLYYGDWDRWTKALGCSRSLTVGFITWSRG